MEEEKLLQEWIDRYDSIVFFGGAGVSTESGIPDFRSVDGIYNQEYDWPPETILSHTFFMQRPEEFYRFYRKKMLVLDAQPNEAHRKLAEFERAGKLQAVVTQNIDGLHQKAGSRKVYELHGSIHRNYCMKCRRFYTGEELQKTEGIPLCSCGRIGFRHHAGSNRSDCPGRSSDRGRYFSGGISGSGASRLLSGRKNCIN